MKKWITLFKSVVFSFMIYIWFLGSSLLVQIDSRESASRHRRSIQENVENWQLRMMNESRNIDTYCRQLDRKELKGVQLKNLVQPVEVVKNKAEERLQQVRKEKLVRDNLIYIPELQQLWCLVPKAASTSWSLKILESLTLKSESLKEDLRNKSIPVQVVLRKHYGNIGTKVYNKILHSENVTRILLVRHPFSRLISAFQNKLMDRKAGMDSMYFYGHYGVKINRAFRKNRRRNKRKEPTFTEFVEYLINTNPMDYDEHWKPISLLCGLCRIKYDHIIRQEELPHDRQQHLKRLGLITTTRLRSENCSNKECENGFRYLDDIPSHKILQLLKKYEDDFKLFGYSIPNGNTPTYTTK